MIRIDLTEEQLRAVLAVIGERVSETRETDTPLEQAERELDLSLLQHELSEEIHPRGRGKGQRVRDLEALGS